MRIKSVVAIGVVLAASAFAFGQVDSTITSSSWDGSAHGWVGGGQWGMYNGGNDWTNGALRNGEIGTAPDSKQWSGMSYDLAGNTSASLTTEARWCQFYGMRQNGVTTWVDGSERYMGTSLMTMELNGIGVALTVIRGEGSNMWDLNGVEITKDGNNVYNNNYNADNRLLQLIQYDIEGNFKLLATYDLTKLDPIFASTSSNWSFGTITSNLSIDGDVVSASFATSLNSATSWSWSGAVTPMGAVGDQAQWGSGSSIFLAGGDTRMAWDSIHLTASVVPEPASLCLLVLGSVALLRRR